MLFDYLLATECLEKVQDVKTKVYYTGGRRYSTGQARTYFQYITERGTFESIDELPMGAALIIKRTPIWHTAVSERSGAIKNPVSLSLLYSGYYPLRIALLVIAAGFGLIRRFDINLRKGASLMAAVLFLLILYELLKGIIF